MTANKSTVGLFGEFISMSSLTLPRVGSTIFFLNATKGTKVMQRADRKWFSLEILWEIHFQLSW